MHTHTENDGNIVIDIPHPIWEQLMNQGKEFLCQASLCSIPANRRPVVQQHPLLVLSRSRPRSEIKI